MPISFLFLDKTFDVKCALCGDIPIDACDTRCCGSVFCERCIHPLTQNASNATSTSRTQYCPCCSATLSVKDVSENHYLRNRVDQLEVSCDVCGERGTRREMTAKHTNIMCTRSATSSSNYSQIYPPIPPLPYANAQDLEPVYPATAPPAYETVSNTQTTRPNETPRTADPVPNPTTNTPDYTNATDGTVTVSKGSYFISLLRSAWTRITVAVGNHRANKTLRREQKRQRRSESIVRCKERLAALVDRPVENSNDTGGSSCRGRRCQRAQRREAKWTRKQDRLNARCCELMERNHGNSERCHTRRERKLTRKADRCARKAERWRSRALC